MNQPLDRLYELLPVIYRMRDEEQGGPLKALLQVIAEQVGVLEEHMLQTYENWFIETAQDWVVPYIGDLVGYHVVHEAGEPAEVGTPQGRLRNKILIPRREVANTIRYRRSKGTLALLELLARDVAGWPARAVEFFDQLAVAHAINHPGPVPRGTVDLRSSATLARIEGPFDTLAHTVDVRRPGSSGTAGWYNLPSVGLFVWRLRSYPITAGTPNRLERVGPHVYTFSVLGNDTPLYVRAEPELDPTQIAGELNLPIPIGRVAFERRIGDYYGPGKSLAIWELPREQPQEHPATLDTCPPTDRTPDPRYLIAPERIVVSDLTDWHYRPRPGQVAVDPVLGRIAFPPNHPPEGRLVVSYHYGFSADLGGGEYPRPLFQPSIDAVSYLLPAEVTGELAAALKRAAEPVSRYLRDRLALPARQLLDAHDEDSEPSDALKRALSGDINAVLVSQALYEPVRFAVVQLPDELRAEAEQMPEGPQRLRLNRRLLEAAYPIAHSFRFYRVGRGCTWTRIDRALEQWRADRPREAIVEIVDGGTYTEQLEIELDAGQSLQIRAANRTRPTLRLLDWRTEYGDPLLVRGGPGSRFILDGLLISGRGVHVEGEMDTLTVRHCTLVPGWGLHANCDPWEPAEPSLELLNVRRLAVTVEHSIVGSIQVSHDEVEMDPISIRLTDSILDATGWDCEGPECEALGAPGWPRAHALLSVVRSTVFGRVEVYAIELAENSIFMGHVNVARRHLGCMRFCYVPPGSRTPRRFNCQPDLVDHIVAAHPVPEVRETLRAGERLRVKPRFTSTRYGTPAYARLSDTCAEEIRRGADDQSEMGVYHDLFEPQRQANLQTRLEEYTPAGADAGIIFAG